MGSSFHCPVDRQPFLAIQEKWIRGKREKVSGVQCSVDPGRPVCGKGRGWQGEVRQGPGLEVPNCTAFCQFTRRLCLGCVREITVAGIIMLEIISVINTPPTVGGVGVSSPIHGLFCFRFSFPHSAGGLSVIYRTLKTTNSISCLQQKVAQNY